MRGVAFIIPARNRPRELARTLGAIGSLDVIHADRLGGASVIIADNGSTRPVTAPEFLGNGVPVRVLRLGMNAGAAARNIAAEETDAGWLVMLDDDSHPVDSGVFEAIESAADDTAAIGAWINLTNGRREAGGLPEVFVGCGVAIRSEAFKRAGGYDAAFGYYAEEYDLAARLILDGWRITNDARFRVLHEKSLAQRNMDLICRRLVRNNAWVAARYAPKAEMRSAIVRDVARYARVAIRESAMAGFGAGFVEMLATVRTQTRRAMSASEWDRFTGVAAVRASLGSNELIEQGPRVCVVDRGKNDSVVDRVIREFGLPVTVNPEEADAVIIGTCSPGPMHDAAKRWGAMGHQVIEPWAFGAADPVPTTSGRSSLTLAA